MSTTNSRLKSFIRKLVFTSLFISSFSFVRAQGTGSMSGVVLDSQTGTPLAGANILLKGTSIGTASNIEGKYMLANLPVGKDTILFRYLGYNTKEIVADIQANRRLQYNVKLSIGTVEGKEVVVTGQMSGQTKAINQQLSSNTIVNVVSSDKIQELPDANVAESIGRLPGITLERNAGEAQKVVIRGLAPKFNSITINGIRIPATDPNDRSVDLSMISSDVLAGIEVFKALTPDKDADAVGGTVNLITKTAPKNFHLDARVQDGYNSHVKQYGQYKGDLSLSDRFFKNKLGLYATISGQNVNRSSNLLTANYIFKSETGPNNSAVIGIEDLNLADITETRGRLSGSVAIDYNIGNNLFVFNSFYSKTTRNQIKRRKRYRVGALRVEYDLADRNIATSLISNALRGVHDFDQLHITWDAAYSKSLQTTPFSNYSRFEEVGAFKSGLITTAGPDTIPSFAINDLSSTWFEYGTFTPELVDDRNITAQIDARYDFKIGNYFSGYLKTGVKYRGKKRVRDIHEYMTDYGVIDQIGQDNPNKFDLYRNTSIAISNFIDPTFSAGNFLGGEYKFGPGLNSNALNAFHRMYEQYYTLNRFIELDNYRASEDISAGYLMTVIKVGQKLTILPGIRFEATNNDYYGKIGALNGNQGQGGVIKDTVGGHNYGEWFPMFHIRYKFASDFDVRFSFTRSLSRPDYFNLVPYKQINYAEATIAEGNPNLKHARATNYDLFFSLYNTYGLFTLGLFYKNIRDIDYISQSRVQGGNFNGYQLTKPVNADRSKVYGFELDLQTHMTFLPSPLDGIIISGNYSQMHSETYFPFFEIGPRSPTPPYAPEIINTFRKGRLPGQADVVANLTFGYERGNFSGRISLIYQGKILQEVGTRSELDGYTDAYARWDAQLSYKLYRGFSIYSSLDNLTNRPEAAFLGTKAFPTQTEFFGWMANLGVRYKF